MESNPTRTRLDNWRRRGRVIALLACLAAPRAAQAQDIGLRSQLLLGCQFNTLAGALAAAVPNDAIHIREGTVLTESITVSKNVSILPTSAGCSAPSAPGANKPVIQAPAAGGRTITVPAGLRLALRQVIIRNGSVAGNGGNILVSTGAVLLLDDVIVRNGRSALGGGLFSRGATVSLSNGTEVRDNSAGSGGGIYIDGGGTFTVQESYVRSNTADVNGGGIFVNETNLDLVNSDVEDNTANGDGGGLYLELAIATLTGSHLIANSAADGGGVFVDRGSLTLVETTVNSNHAARDGGGMFSRDAALDLDNGSWISGNRAEGGGGGAFVDGGGSVVIDSIIRDNQAVADGGGLMVVGETTQAIVALPLAPFAQNTAGGDGGGLVARGATHGVRLTTSAEFESNVAGGNGGGAALHGAVDWTAGRVVFENNSSGKSGGGLYVHLARLVVKSGSVIDNNNAAQGGGLAVDCTTGTPREVVYGQASVSGNSATGHGGGIAVWNDDGETCGLTLVAVNVTDNVAGGSGGGIVTWGETTLDLHELWAHRNEAANGGGLAAIEDGTAGTPRLNIDNKVMPKTPRACQHRAPPLPDEYCVEVRDNVAQRGAGLYIEDARANVAQGGFLGNDAALEGSAVYVAAPGGGSPRLRLENDIFADNSAISSAGVVYVGAGARLEAQHLTFGLNSGTPLTWDAGSAGSLHNSTISDLDPIIIDPALGTLAADCNAINSVTGSLGGAFDTGMTFADFDTSATRGRFQVSASTPLLLDQCGTGPPVDIDNTDRAASTPWDRGAFEEP